MEFLPSLNFLRSPRFTVHPREVLPPTPTHAHGGQQVQPLLPPIQDDAQVTSLEFPGFPITPEILDGRMGVAEPDGCIQG